MKRSRIFVVSYVSKNNMIKVTDTYHGGSVNLPYDEGFLNLHECAEKFLTSKGIKVESVSSGKDADYLVSQDFMTPIK